MVLIGYCYRGTGFDKLGSMSGELIKGLRFWHSSIGIGEMLKGFRVWEAGSNNGEWFKGFGISQVVYMYAVMAEIFLFFKFSDG